MASLDTSAAPVALDLDEIQGAVLRQRPLPYHAAYVFLRVDDAEHGRELLRGLRRQIVSAAKWWEPDSTAWTSLGLSHAGLAALGLPRAVLDSFSPEFRQGMAARAAEIGDVGLSGPEHWEAPFGTGDAHIAISVLAADEASRDAQTAVVEAADSELSGVTITFQLCCTQLPTLRTHLGFVDGIGEPVIEGSGLTSIVQAGKDHYGYLPGFGRPIKAGEFVLGYESELGGRAPMPQPTVLGANSTYASFRKLYIDVAAFRRFLAENARSAQDEEKLAAKMVGRWRSGAPVALAPEVDDPELAGDPERVNDFRYADDPRGLRCPVGAHIRRMNPRDALAVSSTDVAIHRILRRGTTYGPLLADGTADDGADRGIVSMFVGADIARQFEFVKSQWTNDGDFIGLGRERDPLVGQQLDDARFTIPAQPVRRRLRGLPSFVRTCGGEYLFVPSLSALDWIAAGSYTGPVALPAAIARQSVR